MTRPRILSRRIFLSAIGAAALPALPRTGAARELPRNIRMVIGTFTLQGVQVGPLLIGNKPGRWNAMILAMLIANFAMFVMMSVAIRWFALAVAIARHILFPVILMMCVIGAYTINCGIMFDVWTLLIFGWVAVKLGLEIAPFIIGFIPGPRPRSISSKPGILRRCHHLLHQKLDCRAALGADRRIRGRRPPRQARRDASRLAPGRKYLR